MIQVHFSNKTNCPFGAKKVSDMVVLSARFENKIRGEVEINIVGDNAIKTINLQYRGKDAVTDVLSFAWQEIGDKQNLGQIFISYPQIKRQAKEYGVPIKQEFARMLTHGLLHLVGYDHLTENDKEKMFNIQEKIVSAINKL